MKDHSIRAVYECVVYLQALINPRGPAGECLAHLLNGDITVYASNYVLLEIADVARRPKIARKYGIKETAVRRFLARIARRIEVIDVVPHLFDLAADPDDSHYVDLAVATAAPIIVSRDAHLLRLMTAETAEAVDFRNRFFPLRILTPPQFLAEVRKGQS